MDGQTATAQTTYYYCAKEGAIEDLPDQPRDNPCGYLAEYELEFENLLGPDLDESSSHDVNDDDQQVKNTSISWYIHTDRRVPVSTKSLIGLFCSGHLMDIDRSDFVHFKKLLPANSHSAE
ncbi:hypothetical protein KIN20_032943 [Parelaphostrongylus tenuis]|uniref:Uncharacterized protein n=1 Tax=Parelaphostrongylus tenuis TaxID=148309 RepID=A0AAD5R7S8_PARTN|nr:hypothetical protein KIN20_032943 [Parelaphostrongylus tenuis]